MTFPRVAQARPGAVDRVTDQQDDLGVGQMTFDFTYARARERRIIGGDLASNLVRSGRELLAVPAPVCGVLQIEVEGTRPGRARHVAGGVLTLFVKKMQLFKFRQVNVRVLRQPRMQPSARRTRGTDA